MRAVVAILVALVGCGLLSPAYAVPVVAGPDVVVQPRTGFTKAQVAEIRELVSDAEIPTQVRILRHLPEGANGSPESVADDLVIDRRKRTKTPSVALVYSPESIPEFGAAETTEEQDTVYALDVAEDLDATPEEQFVELVRMATTRTGAKRFDEQMAEQWQGVGTREPREGDDGGPSTRKQVLRGIVIGVAVLLLVVFLVFRGRAIVGWWRRRRRAGGLTEAAETAREKNLHDQASADVLAFGQAIDAESMDEQDSLELWNLALEDYDEASRLLDEAGGPRDHRKVIEICARGRDRLAKAQR